MYYTLCEYREKRTGGWEYSPVERWKKGAGNKLFQDRRHIANFRRSVMARGTMNYPDCPSMALPELWLERLSWKEKLEAIRFLKRRLLKLRARTAFTMRDVIDTGIGNPRTTFLVTEAQIRFLYYRTALAATFGTDFANILEIGAGFGGLCGEILKSFRVNRYHIVDLPENLCLTFFYLSHLLGSRLQIIYDEKEADISDSAQVVLLAPWILPLVREGVDLLINTMSFQHMTRDNLEYYFSQVKRLNTRRMYLVNRNVQRDPTDVIADDYPITGFDLIRDGSYPLSGHIERFYRRRKESGGGQEGSVQEAVGGE